uniref:Uncharacterized protein n=1 Tax=Candidozyma auris TaxID=498019 RepID=A0A0L0NWT4_CANAR
MHGLQTGRRKLSNRLVIHGLHTRRAMVAPRKKKKKRKRQLRLCAGTILPNMRYQGREKERFPREGLKEAVFPAGPAQGPHLPLRDREGFEVFPVSLPASTVAILHTPFTLLIASPLSI